MGFTLFPKISVYQFPITLWIKLQMWYVEIMLSSHCYYLLSIANDLQVMFFCLVIYLLKVAFLSAFCSELYALMVKAFKISAFFKIYNFHITVDGFSIFDIFALQYSRNRT